MRWKKDMVLRFLDSVFLTVLFLFQNIILNFFIIKHFNKSSFPFLWFLGDFFCLLIFSLTLYLAAVHHNKLRKRAKGSLSYSNSNSNGIVIGESYRPSSRTSTSSQTSEYTFPNNLKCFSKLTQQLPLAYISWILYSILLISKLATMFKSEIPQTLSKDDFLGPQMIKFVIGLSALIFTLVVEAHKDTQDDPQRNSYINGVSFGIALEILDSASFLSLLIGSESHLLYSYNFENFIIFLSSVNLMLPAITMYKLCATNFGRTYSVPLETLYKVLHLILINGSYLGVRIYLWSMFHTDTSIFIIKNIYAIAGFVRELPHDLAKLESIFRLRKLNGDKSVSSNSNNIPMRLNQVQVTKNGIKNGSISTKGQHGSACSVQISNTNNGNANAQNQAEADVESQSKYGRNEADHSV